MTERTCHTASAMPGLVQHLTTSLDVGGAQAMLVKLIEANIAKRKCARPAVLSLMRPGTFAQRLRQTGCPTYTLGMSRGVPGPVATLRLLRITAMLQPDILQGWMYHGNLAASVAGLAAGRKVPIFWNVRHSLADPMVEKRSSRALFALSARLSRSVQGIIYNSRTAAQQHAAIGFDPSRAIHIPNGFDLSTYHPDPAARARLEAIFNLTPGGILIGMVARNHPMKDHATLVRAVARARSAGHDLRLLFVGPGMDRPDPSLSQTIAQYLPTGTATLAGERTDLASWLPGLDLLALSSAWGEAFPNILGEAMACGVPCIATDIGDSAWVVGEGGLIVPPRDAEAMAVAIERLAALDTGARRNLGAAGRARAIAHFDINDIAVQYRRLYASAVERATKDTAPASTNALASDAGVSRL